MSISRVGVVLVSWISTAAPSTIAYARGGINDNNSGNKALLKVSGGITTALGISFADQFGAALGSSNGVDTFTLTGGSVFVGTSGMYKGGSNGATAVINLNGGVLGRKRDMGLFA